MSAKQLYVRTLKVAFGERGSKLLGGWGISIMLLEGAIGVACITSADSTLTDFPISSVHQNFRILDRSPPYLCTSRFD